MRPLAGRRLWFVGIGGAGPLVVRVPRARLGGRGRRLGPSRDAVPARGSTASTCGSRPSRSCRTAGRRSSRAPIPSVAGTRRAEFLAELVSLRRSIVVAGAHGKTTTTGMIAFVLAELGPRSGLARRRRDRAARRERRRGGGLARRRRGRVRPHGRAAAARDRRRHERRARPPFDLRLGGRGARRCSTRWLAEVPQVVRGWELEPVSFELALPGEHNRRNAATALAALELAGRRARRRGAGARALPRRGAPLRARRRGGRRHRRRRLRPPSVARSRRPSPRRASARTAASSCSSSRTSTPAPAISRTSSARRSRPPTPRA